jgi:hypothetical protein
MSPRRVRFHPRQAHHPLQTCAAAPKTLVEAHDQLKKHTRTNVKFCIRVKTQEVKSSTAEERLDGIIGSQGFMESFTPHATSRCASYQTVGSKKEQGGDTQILTATGNLSRLCLW